MRGDFAMGWGLCILSDFLSDSDQFYLRSDLWWPRFISHHQQMLQPLVSRDAQDNRRGKNSAKEREPQSRGRACPDPGAI